MKQSEINNLSVTELQERLSITKKSYNDLKMAHAISPIENPLQIRSMRKAVARLATEITKKSLS